MRIFEAIQLCDADTGTLIQERRYTRDSGVPGSLPFIESVEWWGMMTVTVYGPNKQPVGQKPVPFKIDATSRTEAFQNIEASMHAAGEGAKQQVQQELDNAAQKHRQQMILGGATEAVVAAARRVH